MAIDYLKLHDWLDSAEIAFSPSFIHGWLTACCCQNDLSELQITVAIKQLVSDENQPNAKIMDAMATDRWETFLEYQRAIRSELESFNHNYQLLLPQSDDVSQLALATREWASGFWLGLQQNRAVSKLNDKQSQEFIKDIQQVSAMPLPESDDQDSLQDLIEIQEYCRMGAIGLYLAMR